MEPRELIRQAIRPSVEVKLYLAGELTVRWEEKQAQLEAAQRDSAGDSLDGGPAVTIAREIEQLEREMADQRLTVSLQALTRQGYRTLLAAHPARRDEAGEYLPQDMVGFNADTFYAAVICACWRSPDLTTEDRDYLLDEVLTTRQFEELAMAAVNVNRGKVDVPFSRIASTILRNSADR